MICTIVLNQYHIHVPSPKMHGNAIRYSKVLQILWYMSKIMLIYIITHIVLACPKINFALCIIVLIEYCIMVPYPIKCCNIIWYFKLFQRMVQVQKRVFSIACSKENTLKYNYYYLIKLNLLLIYLYLI